MTHPFGPPSVRQIRVALEEVDGALRYEPLPEESPEGIDPATELVVWTPGPVASDQHASLTEADQESDLGNRVGDEPAVIFEVPPSLTDLDIHQTLGQDGIEKINRLAEVRGLDALGWYVTFHQSRFQHGIHIPVEGLLWMTVRVFDNLPLPVDRKIELAFHTVLRHELFHFSTDCMIANWELASGHQVYWASRRSKNADGYLPFEEGVANAYMLRGFKYPSRRLAKAPGVLAALSDFCRRQPFGYDLGPDYAKTKAEFLRRCADNAHDYHRVSAAPWHAPDAFDAIVMYPDVIRIDWTRCPIILQDQFDLRRRLGLDISLFRTLERIEETASFRRAHDKLDKPLRSLWAKRKLQLAQSTSLRSLDFKQWKPGGEDTYSVRLDGNYRAHLRRDRVQDVWYAMTIGNHKDMGHG